MTGISILDNQAAELKIKRLAWQVYERNLDSRGILIACINGSGEEVGARLAKEITCICELPVNTCTIKIIKHSPEKEPIILDPHPGSVKFDSILLVDDVINSGRTMCYALVPLLELGAKSIQVAVLVNRNHRKFPVSPDFAGVTMATTLQEHIEVIAREDFLEAYLY